MHHAICRAPFVGTDQARDRADAGRSDRYRRTASYRRDGGGRRSTSALPARGNQSRSFRLHQKQGEQLLHDVTTAARRNPMQAVAVGASVAYPLFRLARAIPMPILLVGAGLFFAGSKTGQATAQKASDVASDLSDE